MLGEGISRDPKKTNILTTPPYVLTKSSRIASLMHANTFRCAFCELRVGIFIATTASWILVLVVTGISGFW